MIDLVGPPGVGKSWLVKQLSAAGIFKKKSSSFYKVCTKSSAHSKLLMLSARAITDLDVLRKKNIKLIYDLNVSQTPGAHLVDEGVSHHFTNELIQLHAESRDLFLTLTAKRAVINLFASPSLVVDRIETRAAHGGYMAGCQLGMGRNELLDFTEKAMKSRHDLCSVLSEENCPVLELEIGIDSSFATTEVIRFIEELSFRSKEVGHRVVDACQT
ncbi:AAA family ATPase [Halomonas organivorans]